MNIFRFQSVNFVYVKVHESHPMHGAVHFKRVHFHNKFSTQNLKFDPQSSIVETQDSILETRDLILESFENRESSLESQGSRHE